MRERLGRRPESRSDKRGRPHGRARQDRAGCALGRPRRRPSPRRSAVHGPARLLSRRADDARAGAANRFNTPRVCRRHPHTARRWDRFEPEGARDLVPVDLLSGPIPGGCTSVRWDRAGRVPARGAARCRRPLTVREQSTSDGQHNFTETTAAKRRGESSFHEVLRISGTCMLCSISCPNNHIGRPPPVLAHRTRALITTPYKGR